jgi:aspartyl-tRNA(Asn)/glutamyl-tRNA(Gln) amidotransferase subunit A
MLAAYDRSVKLLKDLGAETAPLAMPLGYVDLGQIAGDFMAIEGYANVADLIDDDSLPLDPDVRPRLLAGRGRRRTNILNCSPRRMNWRSRQQPCSPVSMPW